MDKLLSDASEFIFWNPTMLSLWVCHSLINTHKYLKYPVSWSLESMFAYLLEIRKGLVGISDKSYNSVKFIATITAEAAI